MLLGHHLSTCQHPPPPAPPSSLRPPLCDLKEASATFLPQDPHTSEGLAPPKTHANWMQISYNRSGRHLNERPSLIICWRGAVTLTGVSSHVTEGQRMRHHLRPCWGSRQHLPPHEAATGHTHAHRSHKFTQMHRPASHTRGASDMCSFLSQKSAWKHLRRFSPQMKTWVTGFFFQCKSPAAMSHGQSTEESRVCETERQSTWVNCREV